MPILRFENVTKQFDQDSYGVREVDFSIEPGEFIFITGPSGSGKTTLMRLLLKEYPFNSGEIFFNDVPISSVKNQHVHLHRRRIGVVFQDYKLIPEMNVWENIALPLWVTGKGEAEVERRVTDLLNLIKLPEKALHFPSQLSGGEAQRIGIARALAIGPEVVIADEPTGNLDPETAQNVARLLKKINELGTTVMIATHDKNIISTFPETRKISLEKGALVKDTHGPKKTTVPKKPEEKPEAEPEKQHHHTAAKEQTIAEDSIPEEAKPTTASQPWWKKIFTTKKPALASQDSTIAGKHALGSEPQAESSSATTPEHKTKPESESSDLITIKEEALDDDATVETPAHENKQSDKTGNKKEMKEKTHKKK